MSRESDEPPTSNEGGPFTVPNANTALRHRGNIIYGGEGYEGPDLQAQREEALKRCDSITNILKTRSGPCMPI